MTRATSRNTAAAKAILFFSRRRELRLAVHPEHDVVRLDVPVDDPLPAGELENGSDLVDNANRIIDGKRSVPELVRQLRLAEEPLARFHVSCGLRIEDLAAT